MLKAYTFSLLILGCVLNPFESNAQFVYATEPVIVESTQIQVVTHPKHSAGMKGIANSVRVPAKSVEIKLQPSYAKASANKDAYWIIETVKQTKQGKEYYLSMGKPSEAFRPLNDKERPLYLSSAEFEVVAELLVDSALMTDDMMQEIYSRSLLQLVLDRQKRDAEAFANYYRTAFYLSTPEQFWFRNRDLSKQFQLEGALKRSFPKAEILVQDPKMESSIPAEIWKADNAVLASILPVSVEGIPHQAKFLYSMKGGLIYSDVRALEEGEFVGWGPKDISPMRYVPASKELGAIKSGEWPGPKAK